MFHSCVVFVINTMGELGDKRTWVLMSAAIFFPCISCPLSHVVETVNLETTFHLNTFWLRHEKISCNVVPNITCELQDLISDRLYG